MRLRASKNGLTVNIVAGTSAVLFSLHLDETKTKDILGFYIHKKNLKKGTEYDIESIKYFEETVPHPQPGARYSTKIHPWQSFLWEDFYVEHKGRYEYSFTPVYGTPSDLKYGKPVTVNLTIPSPKEDIHEVYFNRGVAGSQAYAREFGNRRPDEMEEAERVKALKWLSKGLKEALLNFIALAKDNTCQLRCCFYEFEYEEVLSALNEARKKRKVDVKVIYDARGQKKKNTEAIESAGLPASMLIPRTSDPKYIQHNKFMVLLKNKQPVAVFTGSTNITEKGIFGQCNTGHIIRDKSIAKKYFAYWTCLKDDPDNAATRAGCLNIQADIDELQDGVTAFFSPRAKKKLLSLYSSIVSQSKQLVCGMFPFSFNKEIKNAVVADTDYLKYIIIDKKTKNTSLQSNDFDNVIIWGGVLDTPIYNWLDETHAGKLFKSGTNYIHNKVILIDPLSEAPLVISGSANFSDNSILHNDENTLAIKGNKNVADFYFTEFARIFNHYSSRQDIKKLTKKNEEEGHNPNHLWTKSAEWVPSFYKPTALKHKRKKMFDGMKAERV
jgi:phosphatidylserine/phosphatidylglycerophosphate/cardiolipin synthase-like enzyme